MATPRKWPGRATPSSPSAAPVGSTQVAKFVGVHLGGGRREHDVDAVLGGERCVAIEVARVCDEVGRLGELRRVDEHARDQHVAVGSRRVEERRVAGVQRAHRRDETDDPMPRQVELADRARDDHGCVASASAS